MTFVWARSWYNIYIYVCVCVYTLHVDTLVYSLRDIFLTIQFKSFINMKIIFIIIACVYIYLLLLCGRANDITHPAIVNPA